MIKPPPMFLSICHQQNEGLADQESYASNIDSENIYSD